MRSLGSQTNLNTNQGSNRIQKSASQMIEELGSLQTSTGVANIPNQVHYHHSKRKIGINVLLFGKIYVRQCQYH